MGSAPLRKQGLHLASRALESLEGNPVPGHRWGKGENEGRFLQSRLGIGLHSLHLHPINQNSATRPRQPQEAQEMQPTCVRRKSREWLCMKKSHLCHMKGLCSDPEVFPLQSRKVSHKNRNQVSWPLIPGSFLPPFLAGKSMSMNYKWLCSVHYYAVLYTGALIASTFTKLEIQPFSSSTTDTAENGLTLWLLHSSLSRVTDRTDYSFSLRGQWFRATTHCIGSVCVCGMYGMRSLCHIFCLHAETKDNWAIFQSQWSVILLRGIGHNQILLYLLWVLL